MLVAKEINNSLLDKKIFHLFKKNMKINDLFYALTTNYKISNHMAGTCSHFFL